MVAADFHVAAGDLSAGGVTDDSRSARGQRRQPPSERTRAGSHEQRSSYARSCGGSRNSEAAVSGARPTALETATAGLPHALYERCTGRFTVASRLVLGSLKKLGEGIREDLRTRVDPAGYGSGMHRRGHDRPKG